MKKQINIFEAIEALKPIVREYLSVQQIQIHFLDSVQFGKSIRIYIHYAQVLDENPAYLIELEEHEIKFGFDLIKNRLEKATIKRAIELKIYSPPQLMMF